MKTVPPVCSEPEVGPKYWRSLDELADTPEFRQWVAREFPSGASEFLDPVTRRNFVKVMSASFLLAGLGLTGCRKPEEKIYPFAKMPEGFVHGVPQYFATAMPTRNSAIPLVVKSSDGRPTKIEGNPDHPDSNGGTDVFAQASVLGLYDPDRAMRFAENGSNRSKQQALDFLSSMAKKAGDGTGLAFLLEQSSSPSRARVIKLLADKYPKAAWHTYEPVDLHHGNSVINFALMNQGLTQAGQPYYRIDKASVILSLDADFLGAEADSYQHIRRFAEKRKISEKNDSMNRLYSVESLFTLAGANADHRLRVPPSQMLAVVARLVLEIASSTAIVPQSVKDLAAAAKPYEDWIIPCAKDLKANVGQALVLGGHRLPAAAHQLVAMLNDSLGALGKTVEYRPSSSHGFALNVLADSLQQGKVNTLVILGGNPVYNAPAGLDWAKAQAKAGTVIRLGYGEDETAFNALTYGSSKVTHWDLPAAHFLESWGDARTADGTLVPIQPLIEPLFGGLTELEVLATLGGLDKTSPYDIVRETFRGIAGDGENTWRKFLHDGFLADSAGKPIAATRSFDIAAVADIPEVVKDLAQAASLKPPTADKLDVVFFRDYSMDDGRYNNNGWLQEFPDPITKLTWDNAILMSPKTAKELGLPHQDSENARFVNNVVEVELNGRKLTGPIWVQPGMADYTLGLALGYGREKTGRVGAKAGFNAYKIRPDHGYYFSGATVRKTGDTYVLSTTQSHWAMEGRPVVREANLDQYKKQPDFAKGFDMEKPAVFEPLYPNPLDKTRANGMHQWGMSIDLNSCVGCSACVVACQSENNVPIVGKLMVGKSREMHWLRIDRYYAGPEDDPQAVNQPMLCQHCEAAPCESVCPVNATTHDDEGLNVMVYNRCVGTRYCSNNCPYKVRRFNFFDYNRRPLNELYKSPIVSTVNGEWSVWQWFKDPDRGSKPEDEWQLVKLVKNPDVTVRMRGVMEKCSLCLQRIEQAKIGAKVKARDTGDIRLSEKAGTVPKTACQQACPAEAIVFGDTSDLDSSVSKAKKNERTYKVLDFLNTKPRVTYLAKVRNPNPEMPDYKEHALPYSTEEFKAKKGESSEEKEAAAEKGAS